MSRNVITQLVSVLELPIAHVTGESFLFVSALDSLVSLQAVLPFVFLSAIRANVLGRRSVSIGPEDGTHGKCRTSFARRCFRLVGLPEDRNILELGKIFCLSLEHPESIVLLLILRASL